MDEARETGETREAKGAKARASEAVNRGAEMLSAFRTALDETIQEARERGDLSTDRAKEALRGALERAREASSDAREKFDFVTQGEFDALARRVAELEERVRVQLGGGPDDEDGAEG